VAITVTQLSNRLDTSPGASSEVSGSVTFVTGRHYFAWVTQYRQSSTDPAVATLAATAGNDTLPNAWTDITPDTYTDGLWSPASTTRRRSQLFHIHCTQGDTGTLTASYSGTPADIDIIIIETTGVSEAGFVQTQDLQWSWPTDVLDEPITMSSPASADNRWLAFVATNTNITALGARFELDSDATGDIGEADWTTFTMAGSGSAPTGTYMAGYLDADPNTDLTPGVFYDGTSAQTAYMLVIELEAGGAVEAVMDGSWGELTATMAAAPDKPAVLDGSWGALTGAATFTATTPSDEVLATMTASWGALDANANFVVNLEVIADSGWGGLFATMAAAPERFADAFTGTWGGLTAGLVANVIQTHVVTMNATWGALTGHWQGPEPGGLSTTTLHVITRSRKRDQVNFGGLSGLAARTRRG
jgi:hypothetical protein